MKFVVRFIDRLGNLFIDRNYLLFVLVLLIGFVFFKRISWDIGVSPLIQSDSQIKLYQVVEYKTKGINDHHCIGSNSEFDLENRFYPFRYPWAFFTTNDNGSSCVFQYPTLFAQFFSLIPIPYRMFNSIILILNLFLCALVCYFLYTIFGISKIGVLLLAAILFFVGYGISSALEFSESVPSQILLLLFFYAVFRIESSGRISSGLFFLFGACGGVSIFLRSESLFYLGGLGLMVLYRNRRSLFSLWKQYLPLLAGFFLAVGVLVFYNYMEFHEILGVRSKVSYNDFSRLLLQERIHLVSEFFFGNQNRIGFLYYCFPIIFIIVYAIAKLPLTSIQNNFIAVIFLSFFSVVLLSPYSSGGLYSGMRFTEFTYLLFSIFLISLFSLHLKQNEYRIVLCLILLQIGLGFFHVKKNVKTLDYVKKYHDLFQAKLERYPKAPVVHLSTFDLLLVSDSFLKKPHWIANKQSEFNVLESRFIKTGINQFQVFVYDFKPPKDDNVTTEFYKEWVDTKYEIESKYFRKVSDEEIAGFRLMLWEKK
ncbi:LA_3751/LA_3752 family putative glycosyltransferase [Leptospira meyeri]|uniref:LA_3751/LA_3752 family putative glycosyltransferase n=1 Tax=Leptospira meyeri TaxID=29508 RepID=UPI0010834114|nr:hypothetical protein [Leptospira meyeri]TGM20799.1 hypothetical protein EHQ73_12730 [Leptospira meyeri]TGM62131.1 hypothetical protein EHQ93_12475 [Leptospira meyeri]